LLPLVLSLLLLLLQLLETEPIMPGAFAAMAKHA
jgi:hypothetical protein